MAGLNLGLKNKLKIAPVKEGEPRTADLGNAFEVLINPSGYQRHLEIRYNKRPTLGQPAGQVKFSAVCPEKLTLPQLVFDGTGVVALYGMQSVTELINAMMQVLYTYQGEIHEPNLVCFQWGDMNFFGRIEKIDIDYTLFKPSGEPLRAKVTLGVVSDMSVKESLLRANRSSPDMSHLVTVRAGDTLPLLCQRIYSDPAYYTAVARVNRLVNFRDLLPGSVLRFPPLS